MFLFFTPIFVVRHSISPEGFFESRTRGNAGILSLLAPWRVSDTSDIALWKELQDSEIASVAALNKLSSIYYFLPDICDHHHAPEGTGKVICDAIVGMALLHLFVSDLLGKDSIEALVFRNKLDNE